MAFSQHNSCIPPRSPRVGLNLFVCFDARQAKSSGASSSGASGSVREVPPRLRDMLGATFRLAGFSTYASSRSRETRALVGASRDRKLRTLSLSSLLARCSSLRRRWSCSARPLVFGPKSQRYVSSPGWLCPLWPQSPRRVRSEIARDVPWRLAFPESRSGRSYPLPEEGGANIGACIWVVIFRKSRIG